MKILIFSSLVLWLLWEFSRIIAAIRYEERREAIFWRREFEKHREQEEIDEYTKNVQC